MDNAMVKMQEFVFLYGFKILGAVIILFVGKLIAGFLRNLVQKMMQKKGSETTIVAFTGNLTYVLLMIFVILAALSQLGIKTTSFIAILGAAALAIGFALQGALANFAAGFLMLVFKPFKVGDFVEGAGVTGTVEEIQLFTTQLKTPDNKTVIIPNAHLTAGNITNYSAKDTRRVDLTVGISYSDDIDKAKTVAEELLSKDPRVLKDPPPMIKVVELGNSSVNLVVRPWVKTADYWDVYFDTTENLKKNFDAAGITIPFPQQDVHLFQESKED
jgi:small conductance mechanosensitive channel